MSYSLIVKPEAELDMLKSAKWYEEKQVDLGIRFLDEIEDKLNLVTNSSFPLLLHFFSDGLIT